MLLHAVHKFMASLSILTDSALRRFNTRRLTGTGMIIFVCALILLLIIKHTKILDRIQNKSVKRTVEIIVIAVALVLIFIGEVFFGEKI